MANECTGCGTVLNHNLEIATTDSLCPSCSTGSLVNPNTANPGGNNGCCVESVNGKTGVVVLTINDIDLEGNTFFTVSGARAVISGATPIDYNDTTGVISHANSGAAAGTYGGASKTVTLTVNATGHITNVTEHTITTGGVGPNVAAIEPLTGVGYLIRTGTNTWALRSINGTAGNISVSPGDGVAGVTTIDLVATGVTAGTYGSSTHYPVIQVDTFGRITGVTNMALPTAVIPSHTHALNDLSDVSVASPTTGHYLQWNGTSWVAAAVPALGDDWGSQVVQSDSTLSGTGITGNLLAVVRPVPAYGTVGHVLTVDSGGTTISWQAPSAGAGDDWGAQVIQSSVRFSGTGVTGNVLELAQQGATVGQVLYWSGSAWIPTSNGFVQYDKSSLTASGTWAFAQSPTATDPDYTSTNADLDKVERLLGTNQESVTHIDAVLYIDNEDDPDTIDYDNELIATVPVGYRPMAEVVLPIGVYFSGSHYSLSTGSFSGTQNFAHGCVVITPGGDVRLSMSAHASTTTVAANPSGTQSIIIPIFGRYFTKVT